MKKATTAIILILAVAMVFGLAACGTRTANVGDDHVLAAAIPDTPKLPTDRLYGIITYGGEDHLMVAEEHKEEGHYGVEYIRTYIDTDGVDNYEAEPVSMYFECPVCGMCSHATITVGDVSPSRIYWCRCENPWVIGVTIREDCVVNK